jgi:hypothetical protein
MGQTELRHSAALKLVRLIIQRKLIAAIQYQLRSLHPWSTL